MCTTVIIQLSVGSFQPNINKSDELIFWSECFFFFFFMKTLEFYKDAPFLDDGF